MSSFLASAIVDKVFAAPGNHSSLEILFAIYGYAFQIYADFSGYTDIAIGIALLLGIRFPPNFDSPYTAAQPAGLLAALAHDAVALAARLPLHPARRQPRRPVDTYRNLMLTMLIGGLWHGATWTFVVWGGIHGIGLAVERLPARPPRAPRPARAGRHARAPVRAVGRHLQHRVPGVGVLPVAELRDAPSTCSSGLFTPGAAVAARDAALLVFTSWPCWPASSCPSGRCGGCRPRSRTFPLAAQGVTLAGCFFLIDALGPTGVAPFIYFQF